MCVGSRVVVRSSFCVLQEFMGWCHSYAALSSRVLQNSHLRFYTVAKPWERVSRTLQDKFIYGPDQSALMSGCARDAASFQLMLKENVFNKKKALKKQLQDTLYKTKQKWIHQKCFTLCARTSVTNFHCMALPAPWITRCLLWIFHYFIDIKTWRSNIKKMYNVWILRLICNFKNSR